MYRTFPLAVGVTAGQTAIRLGFRLTFRKRFVDFNKLDLTDLQRFLRRINALQVDKLINILAHFNSLLRLHAQFCRTTTTVAQQGFDIAGLGLH